MKFVKNLQSFLQSYNKSLINQACSGPYWENIGPRSFLHGPRHARSVLSRPWADILTVQPSHLVNKINIILFSLYNHTPFPDLQMVNIGLRVLARPQATMLPEMFRRLGLDFDERVLPSIMNEVHFIKGLFVDQFSELLQKSNGEGVVDNTVLHCSMISVSN